MVKETSLAGDPRSRHSETAFRGTQDKLRLFTRHAVEPVQKIINSRAVFVGGARRCKGGSRQGGNAE
ncbi:MAG: hypothetical protein ACREQW_04525, partial [Candidatus Binatia bacterium]